MYLVIDTASGQTVRQFAATRLPQALYMAAMLNVRTSMRPEQIRKWRERGMSQRFVVKSSRGDPKPEG